MPEITKENVLNIVENLDSNKRASKEEFFEDAAEFIYTQETILNFDDSTPIRVEEDLMKFYKQMELDFEDLDDATKEHENYPSKFNSSEIVRILGLNEKQKWIPKGKDEHEKFGSPEEVKSFFFQRLLLKSYKHEEALHSNAINNPAEFENGVSNKGKTIKQDLWLYAKFNGLKEEGKIPEGYKYKAFLGLVRDSIVALRQMEEEEAIVFIVDAVSKDFHQQEIAAAATVIQSLVRGIIDRKGKIAEKRLERLAGGVGVKKLVEDSSYEYKIKDPADVSLEERKKNGGSTTSNNPEAEAFGETLESGLSSASYSSQVTDDSNALKGEEEALEAVKDLFSEENDGSTDEVDDHQIDEGRINDDRVDEGLAREEDLGSLNLDDDDQPDDDLIVEGGEDSSIKDHVDEGLAREEDLGSLNLDDDQPDDDLIVEGGEKDHFGEGLAGEEDRDYLESDDDDQSVTSTVNSDTRSSDTDNGDSHSDDGSTSDNGSLINDHIRWIAGNREIDYKYLEYNHYVSNEGKNYLIPEITGTKYSDDEHGGKFLTGKVLQYGSGLPVSCYKDLNDFSQDVEKAALKKWKEGEESLLSSIAHIEDKNIGAKYCVVNASVRGVTKIFISDEEFNKIKEETDQVFLRKYSEQLTEPNLHHPPLLSEKVEELMRSVSWEYSDKIARDVEKSIGNEVINGLDTSEVESIAKDFSRQYLGSSEPKEELENEISKILEAPVPHTNLNGIGFHRPRGTKIVSVGFSYNETGDKDDLNGDKAAYAYISGSYQCYVRCQVCPKDGNMKFCQDGKVTSKLSKRGDTVIDQNTISFLNPDTGKYTNVEASTKALKQHLEKITEEGSSYYSTKTNLEKEAQKILKQYQAMQIKVTSQVNRVGFEQEPDIERKVSIMHEGRILSYNAEASDTTIGKKKIAKDFFIDSSSGKTKEFVKINKISLSNTKSVDLYVKFSTENGKVTHESKPFFAEEDTDGGLCYGELTHDYIKRNSDSSVSGAAVDELLSRAEYDCKNTKLIFGDVGDAGYKISTSEDFAGPRNITTPSSTVSEAKVTSLLNVKESWIKDAVIRDLPKNNGSGR